MEKYCIKLDKNDYLIKGQPRRYKHSGSLGMSRHIEHARVFRNKEDAHKVVLELATGYYGSWNAKICKI